MPQDNPGGLASMGRKSAVLDASAVLDEQSSGQGGRGRKKLRKGQSQKDRLLGKLVQGGKLAEIEMGFAIGTRASGGADTTASVGTMRRKAFFGDDAFSRMYGEVGSLGLRFRDLCKAATTVRRLRYPVTHELGGDELGEDESSENSEDDGLSDASPDLDGEINSGACSHAAEKGATGGASLQGADDDATSLPKPLPSASIGPDCEGNCGSLGVHLLADLPPFVPPGLPGCSRGAPGPPIRQACPETHREGPCHSGRHPAKLASRLVGNEYVGTPDLPALQPHRPPLRRCHKQDLKNPLWQGELSPGASQDINSSIPAVPTYNPPWSARESRRAVRTETVFSSTWDPLQFESGSLDQSWLYADESSSAPLTRTLMKGVPRYPPNRPFGRKLMSLADMNIWCS